MSLSSNYILKMSAFHSIQTVLKKKRIPGKKSCKNCLLLGRGRRTENTVNGQRLYIVPTL